MDFDTVLTTSQRKLHAICKFSYQSDHLAFKSELFRSYYGGNGLQIYHTLDKNLDDWEATFQEHFPANQYRHKTFTFLNNSHFEKLKDQAKEKGYEEVVELEYMSTNEIPQVEIPAFLKIKKFETDQHWKAYRQFNRDLEPNVPWFSNEGVELCRYLSETIKIEWFYLTDHSDKMLATLGIFPFNSISRLQDVATHPNHRRQKYSSYLVSYAIDYALNKQKTNGLSLQADLNYHAIEMYEKLGFKRLGSIVELMKHPPK